MGKGLPGGRRQAGLTIGPNQGALSLLRSQQIDRARRARARRPRRARGRGGRRGGALLAASCLLDVFQGGGSPSPSRPTVQPPLRPSLLACRCATAPQRLCRATRGCVVGSGTVAAAAAAAAK
jgi:hypothetical protein